MSMILGARIWTVSAAGWTVLWIVSHLPQAGWTALGCAFMAFVWGRLEKWLRERP